jgi:hypothetical protein
MSVYTANPRLGHTDAPPPLVRCVVVIGGSGSGQRFGASSLSGLAGGALVQVISLDLPAEVPRAAHEECDVDAAQRVVDGGDQQRVPGEEEARQSQRRVLGQRDLVRGTVQVEEARTGDEPLRHRGPISRLPPSEPKGSSKKKY